MAKDDKVPYFPFYPDDFSSDGKVEAMTTAGVGAYILLLCKAWREDPPGSLPNSDPVLSRWARLTLAEWQDLKPAVLAAFSLGKDDRYHQKRMRTEFQTFAERRKERSAIGLQGAKKRWLRHSQGNGKSMPSGGGDRDEIEVEIPEQLRTPEFNKAWEMLEQFRRERGIKAYTPTGKKTQLKRLAAWGSARACAAIEHSIANNYQGIFEPNHSTFGTARQATAFPDVQA